MKTTFLRFQLCLWIVLLLAVASWVAPAAEPDSGITRTLKSMLAAIQNGSPEQFAKEGTATFKEQATQSVIDGAKATEDLGARLAKGYQTVYLAELKQKGHKVQVWKITFTDGGDDMLVRVSFQNGKVAGFFIH